MPITPSYTWQESPTWVTIHVALRSVSLSSIDIITTDCYVKVNCSPYLFQVDLFEDIESRQSSAVVENGFVRFFLVKKHHCLWGRLHAVGEKKEIILKRERSLDQERERSNQLKADVKVKAAQIGRLAVQSQMKLDEEKRKLVEERKAKEIKFERDMIQSWQAELNVDPHPNRTCSDQEFLLKETTAKKKRNAEGHNSLSDFEHTEAADKSFTSIHAQNMQHETKQYSRISEVAKAVLPAPRQNVCVCVKFTPKFLSLNLPARESRDNVRLKEKKVTTSDTIDISEREPLFLQDRGDEFYSRSDFKGAINAYTEAVQKDPSLFLSLANRAACFLQLKQFRPCVEDCTTALLLLQERKMDMLEEPDSNSEASNIDKVCADVCLEASANNQLKSVAEESLKILQDFIHSKARNMRRWYDLTRKKILVRRGTALCNLKEFNKAKQDFDEALLSHIAVEVLADTFSITE